MRPNLLSNPSPDGVPAHLGATGFGPGPRRGLLSAACQVRRPAVAMEPVESRPQMRTVERLTCPLCGSSGTLFYRDLRDCLYGAPGCWGFRRCPNPQCGLLWLDPAPVAEDIALAYQRYFTHLQSAQTGSSLADLRSRLYACYRQILRVTDFCIGLHKACRAVEEMCLGDCPPGRLLDVGCGDGAFLHRMQQRGWEVAGVDFDAAAVAAARQRYGLELFAGDLHDAHFPAENFDAVTLNHVIEHLYNPLETLQEIRRVLRPRGLLVLVTPNPDSFGHQQYGADWFGLDPPRHLHLFRPANLQALLERTGFRVRTLHTTAVHADVFLGASRSIRQARRTGQSGPVSERIRPLRALVAALERYGEHLRLRRSPMRGEEIIVTAQPAG
jgi:2-polyprenyl-3-methyl-5-hydroxy-6-metoxy-1,4-benzoquinol methylase